MTTEPKGVQQNYSAPGNPPNLKPVAKENWKMFATLDNAKKGLQMIHKVAPDAQMKDATEGAYSQFVYDSKEPDIRARIAHGTVGKLAIEEFPSDILDRNETPQMFVDHYQKGQEHVLKCREATPEIGELYWDKE